MKPVDQASKIKHFVSPKKTTELPQPDVILKVAGFTAEQIIPGPNQIVEWDGGEELDPPDPLKRRVTRGVADKKEVKIKVKQGGAIADQMNVWVTWADLSLQDGTPEIQPSTDIGGFFTLNAKISYKYTCQPNAMFDLAQDIPDFNLLPAPSAPGGNQIWPSHEPLANGAAIRYDATRQVRAVLKSSDSVVLDWQHGHEGYPDIPNYPTDIAEGNDDPNMGGEIMPYQGAEGIQGIMRDVDSPKYSLSHGDGLPDATFLMAAQFRQYARVQIAGTWFRCSDLELSYLKLKFKKTNGKWADDNSSFVTGNGNSPPQ